MRTVEATLLADGSGEICQHPYIYRQVDKLLAKWAYKVLTGGGSISQALHWLMTASSSLAMTAASYPAPIGSRET